jgi:hypothetical protein
MVRKYDFRLLPWKDPSHLKYSKYLEGSGLLSKWVLVSHQSQGLCHCFSSSLAQQRKPKPQGTSLPANALCSGNKNAGKHTTVSVRHWAQALEAGGLAFCVLHRTCHRDGTRAGRPLPPPPQRSAGGSGTRAPGNAALSPRGTRKRPLSACSCRCRLPKT